MSQSLTLGAVSRPVRAARPWRVASPRRIVSPLALLLLWEALSRVGVIFPRIIAAPSTILASAWDLALNGDLATDLAASSGPGGHEVRHGRHRRDRPCNPGGALPP